MDRALLEMEYRRGDNRHTLRLHVRAVDPIPVGADGALLSERDLQEVEP